MLSFLKSNPRTSLAGLLAGLAFASAALASADQLSGRALAGILVGALAVAVKGLLAADARPEGAK